MRELLDVTQRAFVACLSGASVHVETAKDLRTRFGPASCAAAAQAIAEALRSHAEKRTPAAAALQEERASISAALDELLALLDPDGGDALDIDVVEARPTLVHALSELARSAPSSMEASAVAPRAFLRVRCTTVAAAHAIERARGGALSTAGVVAQPSAPDELVAAASGDAKDAVAKLVRAAGLLSSSLGAA
ncbi:MAG TPA: hypothetical protein VGO62_03695, partial [Myxococcota bacterium]